jgi:hypothetical protein
LGVVALFSAINAELELGGPRVGSRDGAGHSYQKKWLPGEEPRRRSLIEVVGFSPSIHLIAGPLWWARDFLYARL